MNKQPEITAKTRRNIMDAFWLLYSQMDIDKITVGAITKKAGYNRSTFYAYFTDIYDLLDQIENEMVENLSEKFASFFSETLPLDFQVFSGKCAEIFAENGDKLFYLLRHNNKFADKLKKSLLPVVVTYSGIIGSEKEKDIEYVQTFIFSAMLGMVTHWYDSGKDRDVKDFVRFAQTLVANGVLGYTQVNLFK